MYKKIIVLSFVFLCFLFFSNKESFSEDKADVQFKINKTEVLQGSFVSVTAEPHTQKSYYALVGGQRFDFYKHIDKQIVLIGVDLGFKPGVYKVEIFDAADDASVFLKEIKVVERERGDIEKITVTKKFDWEKVKKDRAKNANAIEISLPYFLFTDLDYPIKDMPKIVMSGFGQWRGRSFHRGVDYKVWQEGDDEFTFIYVVGNGIVKVNESQEVNGKIVIVDHGGYIFSYYLHLSELENENETGHTIFEGDKIGRGGGTGYVTGPHLHFGIKIKGLPSGLIWIDSEEFIEFFKNLK